MSPWSNRKPALGQQSTLIKHVTLMSYKLEPMIWSRDTGQRITWFSMCQLIITWCHMSKKYTVNQGCMSLSTYYLKNGRHLAWLHRRRRHTPTSKLPLDMITMRKSLHGFPLIPYMAMGLRLAALWAARAPLQYDPLQAFYLPRMVIRQKPNFQREKLEIPGRGYKPNNHTWHPLA